MLSEEALVMNRTYPNSTLWNSNRSGIDFEVNEKLSKMLQKQKAFKSIDLKASILCELAGTRTQDPYIKSVLLYQLSYQFFSLDKADAPCFLGVQKYGKKKCRQIFTGLFFHGKLVVINKFAASCQGKTARPVTKRCVAATCDVVLQGHGMRRCCGVAQGGGDAGM
jgi:hypothetical protein